MATTEILHADPTRRTRVRFLSGEVELAGHLYRPPGLAAPVRTPAVAMCGPISSVKEQTLPHYAERLADAGYTVLTFDAAGFGESEGEPRFRYDPHQVIADYGCAVNHLLTRDDVDPDRVGLVGVCMGGGYAVSVAARDKRVRAAVSVAGGYDIGGTFQQALGAEAFAGYLRSINDLVQQQYVSGKIEYVPTTVKALSKEVPIAGMATEEAYDYYDRTHHADAPSWSEVLTADSLPPFLSYNAVAAAPLVQPTPLMIIHGTNDAALLPAYAQSTFDAAGGIKELVWIETDNHVQLYDQSPYVEQAVSHVLRWLDGHLA